MARLGQLDEAGRLGVQRAADDSPAFHSRACFANQDRTPSESKSMRVRFALGLDRFLCETLPDGRVDVPWSAMALILVIVRLCEPSSELSIAEEFVRNTAVLELLGVRAEKVYDNRLYRALDQLLPHKAADECARVPRLKTVCGVFRLLRPKQAWGGLTLEPEVFFGGRRFFARVIG